MTKRLSELNDNERENLYRDIVLHWGKGKSAGDIAKQFNVKDFVVTGIVAKLRKKGIPLPKLSIQGYLNDERVEKLKDLFRNR